MSESRNLLINLSFVSLSKKYFIFVQITFLGVKFAKKKTIFEREKSCEAHCGTFARFARECYFFKAWFKENY